MESASIPGIHGWGNLSDPSLLGALGLPQYLKARAFNRLHIADVERSGSCKVQTK